MNYQAALDYLYGFINKNVTRKDRYAPEAISLETPRALFARLGNPQNAYPTVHITGTKGKGSVGAMSAAILQAAGLKVGLYSSPHLQDFRERFKINSRLITEAELLSLIELAPAAVEGIENPTWFEVVTALAFTYFQQQQVDIAVIEVGLGGRLDATNVITPLVSVITSLSYDHMELLGYTLPEIAAEKAGIIKPGVPVVSAPQPAAALEVIEKAAAEHGSKLTLVGRDWQYEALGGDWRLELFNAAPTGESLKNYSTVLLGKHQVINATVALAAMTELRKSMPSIPESALQTGLQQVNWCGRLEIIRQAPAIILDAAHNADSAHWLAQTLVERFPQQPRILVFGAKSDKDIDGMLAALLPTIDHLILTQAIDARAESPDRLAHVARAQGYQGDIEIITAVPDALNTAVAKANGTGLICVTGSLYLVGEVRTLYGLQVGQASYLKQEENHVRS